jgi:hypothetical protein
MKAEITPELDKELEAHPLHSKTLELDDGTFLFEFTIPEESIEGVVKPFLEGRYSKIDRTFVEKHFPDDAFSDTHVNRRILDKDPSLREYWESKLGISLPEDAEV